ncbi:unnamed protein product [Notodromas monacha]|uniref:UDENN domain-containing protein n=1 Tax=Notodromas monacha TaxID=399045 RepID=A0A7R9GIX6_9CRUS|nr:unnamed protein product [Notodromas monacha]CAG0922280.1 unnamed protein product [Notodromas monacha]
MTLQPVLELENNRVIQHVLVVGFHHKKGAVVEYAFPPLSKNSDIIEVPELWRHMPSLAIPDGAHNFEWDIIYFHLPSLEEPGKALFCISCYRQIQAQDVKNPTKDITRSSVQKAICVISRLPLFGHIRVHVWEVADHYMKGGDFSVVGEFPKLFRNLNLRLSPEMLRSPELFFGLKVIDLLLLFRHRLLVLLKCILLEKRILFVHSPVHALSASILAMLSLLPRMLEDGLFNATDIPTSSYSVLPPVGKTDRKFSEDSETLEPQNGPHLDLEILDKINLEQAGFPFPVFGRGNVCHPFLALPYVDLLSSENVRGFVVGASNILFKQKKHLSDVIVELEGGKVDILDPELKKTTSLSTEDSRFMDYLVRRVTESSDGAISPDSTCSSGCKKQGADDWVRKAFWVYFIHLAATVDQETVSSQANAEMQSDSFSGAFVSSWRETRNFQLWDRKAKIVNVPHARHPFAGSVSMADMKIKLAQISHNMQTTERGKKINESLAVTGKAVGGAIEQAKGFISNLWTGLSTQRSLLPSEDKEGSSSST